MKKRTTKIVSKFLKFNIPKQAKFNGNPVMNSNTKPEEFLLNYQKAQFPKYSFLKSGEHIVCCCFDVSTGSGRSFGDLYLTNYRMKKIEVSRAVKSMNGKNLFVDEVKYVKILVNGDFSEFVDIPLTCILTYYGNDLKDDSETQPLQKYPSYRVIGELCFQSKLFTKIHVFVYNKSRVLLRQRNKREKEFSNFQHRIMFTTTNIVLQNKKISNLFAFFFRPAQNSPYTQREIDKGYEGFSIIGEFTRQGITFEEKYSAKSRGWRVTSLNENYQLCNSYPRILIVPSNVSDSVLKRCSEFRSNARIPILTWKHPKNPAVLMRSSQPLTGLRRSRSKDDELLISLVRQNCCDANLLHIIDCRPKKNIVANQFMGKGTEINKNYTNVRLSFIGIENIQVMQSCFYALVQFLHAQKEGSGNDTKEEEFLQNLEACSWFKHIIKIIKGAVKVVKILEFRKKPVLVHCSDGWDRTSQVCSIAQMLLDPYFRTIDGFQVLIDKDWCGYGYKYRERSGILDVNHPDEEISPIFFQFIECLSYLWFEFPGQFEFNQKFLTFMAENIYSSQFGNFICNTEKERGLLAVKQKTISIWTHVQKHKKMFTNQLYNSKKTVRVLIPSTNMYRIVRTFFNMEFIYHENALFNQTTRRYEKLLKEKNKKISELTAKIKQLERKLTEEKSNY